MAPLVAALLKGGFSILAGAVASKGQELVKEKLGVDISSMLGSEEGRYKLKELEIQHEQMLLQMTERADIRQLEYFKEEVEEKKSARLRDSEFIKAGFVNWRSHAMFFIAVSGVLWLTYIIWISPMLDEYVKGIFTLVLGRFLGYLDNIYNFEFGTTRVNRAKDQTIERLSGGSQK